MRIAFSIITCALLACCAIQSPQAGPVGFRLSSGFKPSQIPGLKLWLDASQIAGLNDGDAVATWSDLSGNALHFTQSTASKRPLYKTNVQNGLPGVLSDGVDDFLESAAVNWSAFTQGTYYVVIKASSFAATQVFAERSPNTGSNPGGFTAVCSAGDYYFAVGTSLNTASEMQTSAASGVVVTYADFGVTPVSYSALNGTNFINRTINGTGGNFGNYANYLFSRAGVSFFTSGYVLEMGVYMGEIGDPARAQLTTYLRNKWGY